MKVADFNRQLQDHGVEKYVLVQKICKISDDETEVRSQLDSIWEEPHNACKILEAAYERNKKKYELENLMEHKEKERGESEGTEEAAPKEQEPARVI